MVEGTPGPDHAAPQRRGLGRGLAEIIDASATVRVSPLLGQQAAPDAHYLQRAGASLAQAIIPSSTARWIGPGDDRAASTRVRFDFNDHTAGC